MSDINITIVSTKSLDTPKDGAVSSKEIATRLVNTPQVKAEQKVDEKANHLLAKSTDLNFSIDRDDNALHLRVKSSEGEVIREVVFDRIDPSLFDVIKLKGVFVDGKS